MTGIRPLTAKFREIYGRAPEVVARAPGRIEFIGNHTDYNGGTVLGAAIDRSVWVAIAPRADGLRRFRSDRSDEMVEQPAARHRRTSRHASWVKYTRSTLSMLPESKLRAAGQFELSGDVRSPGRRGPEQQRGD